MLRLLVIGHSLSSTFSKLTFPCSLFRRLCTDKMQVHICLYICVHADTDGLLYALRSIN